MEEGNQFLILPGRKYEGYEYPDLDVSIYRTGFNTGVELIDKRINTAQEKSGNLYIGDIVQEEALRLNLCLGHDGTPTIRQLLDLKHLLERGIDDEEKVLYADGKKVNREILMAVYDEIFDSRLPWRGEFLDAHFELKNGVLYLNQDHKLVYGLLIPQYSQPVLEDTLMENCDIDLKSCNEQGLATRKGNGVIRYSHPFKDSVAWFSAYSNQVGLFCDGNSIYQDRSLGVRAKKIHSFREI